MRSLTAEKLTPKHLARPAAWPLLKGAIVVALGAVAALPLLRPAPTRSADGLLHLYRLVEFDRILAQGALYPRWAPDLAQGYGFPLFSFYPPLAYYVAETWHLLGFSIARSYNLTLAFSVLLSLLAAYLLARDLVGEPGGLLTGLLYAYAPVSLYNTLYRGGPGEALAWALAPLVLWSFRRLVVSGQRRWLLGASLSYAGLLLAHHLSALTFTPLLCLFAAGTWLCHRTSKSARDALVALLLALGCSAFFTVPAFFERHYVQIDRVFGPSHFDFHNHFVGWDSLLAGPVTADVALMNPSIPYAIGWLPLAAALAGLLVVVATRPTIERLFSLGGAIVVFVLMAMMQSSSIRIWEAVEILKYLQFPWRLLSPLSLVLALSAGGVGLILPAKGRSSWMGGVVPVLAAGVLFIYSTPLLYPHYADLPSANPTVADVLRYEREGGVLGLTSAGDYLPLWVEVLPDPLPMAAQYETPAALNWLDEGSLPDGAVLLRASNAPNALFYAFDSPAAFLARINQFFFPGWTAYLDGARVEVEPVAPHGLLGVLVPAGRHDLQLRFEDTLLRAASRWLSLASLVILAGLAWPRQRAGTSEHTSGPGRGATLPTWSWLLLLATLSGYLALKGLLLDRHDSALKVRGLAGNRVWAAQVPSETNFGEEMLFLGHSMDSRFVAAGESVRLQLYWRALRRMATEYSVTVQLVDGWGRLWGQKDSWHPGGYPTPRWQLDEYNLDEHELQVLPGTPPGEYLIRVGVYTTGGQPVAVLDEHGIPEGTSVVLDRIEVTRPARPPALGQLGMQERAAIPMYGDLELVGYNVPSEPVRPGQRIGFTIFWRAIGQPQADYQAVATLQAQQSGFSHQIGWPVAGQSYPSSAWRPDEVVRAQYELRIPAATPAGTLSLKLALSGPERGLSTAVDLGSLEVLPVARQLDVPPMERTVGADLGHELTLLGYDLDRRQVERGQTVHLRLHWRAQREMAKEYKVFTHLLDGENRIWAQQDSVPAQGRRPTTGWIEGEVVADDYVLVVRDDAPPGEHVLEVGVYEDSGQRLTVYGDQGQDLGDRVLLETVLVH